MDIKDIVLNIRRENDLSQDQLAEKLFVTRQAVSRWENGETDPGKETMKLISKLFNVSANALLGLAEDTICQSCGMDLVQIEDFGTQENDTVHTDYCNYCMQNGKFSNDRTVEEMVESNLRFLEEYNAEKGLSFTPDEARTELKQHLSTLKRWKKQA